MVRVYPSTVVGQTKICTKCGVRKDFRDFYKCKSHSTGRTSKCIDCGKKYYADNISYFQKDRENRREELRAYYREWHKKNRDKQLIKSRESHRRAQQEKHLPSRKASRLLSSAQSRAKKRGISCEINRSDVTTALENGSCQVTGIRFAMDADAKMSAFSPSIDQIIPGAGYTRDNVQYVCAAYNVGKSNHPELDFIAMCVAVAERYASNPAVIQRLKELRNAEF